MWSDWGVWSACNKFCDGGKKFRTRGEATVAQHGGKACPTNATHTNTRDETTNQTTETHAESCNTDPCPRMSYVTQTKKLF